MARTKITIPLDQRVCARGHVGQYRKRGDAIACHECSKIAVARFRERAGVPHSPVPLKERVCNRGHVGQYQTSPSGYTRCMECARALAREYLAQARDSTREQVVLAKLTKRREELTTELAELTLRIALEESIIKQRQERE